MIDITKLSEEQIATVLAELIISGNLDDDEAFDEIAEDFY